MTNRLTRRPPLVAYLARLLAFSCALVSANEALAAIAPAEGFTLRQTHVLFEWTPVPAVSSHDLEVVVDDGSPDPFFDGVPVVTTNVPAGAPRTAVTSGLDWETAYAWRVRGVAASPLAWGPTHRFDIAALPAIFPTFTITTGTGTPEPGLTLFNLGSLAAPGIGFALAVDAAGTPVWWFEPPERIQELRQLPSGRMLLTSGGRAFEITLGGQPTWVSPADPDLYVHHEACPMPNGNILAPTFERREVTRDGELQLWLGERFVEIERATGLIVWEWSTFDNFSTLDFDETSMALPNSNPGPWQGTYDWTHSNAAVYDAADNDIYISVRNLSRITRIDRNSGDIVYNMGFTMPSGDADFGDDLFSFQHAPELLPNGNMLVYDNGNRRGHVDATAVDGISKVIELAFTGSPPTAASIVFEWQVPGFTPFVGDVDRQPGGTTLVTAGSVGSLYEIDSAGNLVWQLDAGGPPDWLFMYRSERIPSLVVLAPADSDGDGLIDDVDNCADQANAAQTDIDGDIQGDSCDLDDDEDLLLDIHETNTGVFVSPTDTGTDPLLFDTDGDGIGDGKEVRDGSDPLDPHSPTSVPGLSLGARIATALGLVAAAHLARGRRRAPNEITRPDQVAEYARRP